MSGNAGFGTGHGATISFTTLQGTYFIRSIDLWTESGPSPDVSHLNTTGQNNSRVYIPPDLLDVSPFTVEVLLDTTGGTAGDGGQLPAARSRDAGIIITYPIRESGNTTNATITRPGWIVSRSWGTLQSNVEQVATIQIQWEDLPEHVLEAA
jgi:hypothetical protein